MIMLHIDAVQIKRKDTEFAKSVASKEKRRKRKTQRMSNVCNNLFD